MKIRHLYILLFLLMPFSVLAQSQNQKGESYIEGVVYDDVDNMPIDFATIRLLNKADSTYLRGVASGAGGNFKLPTTKGNFILQISAISYHTNFHDFTVDAENLRHHLDTIYLKEAGILLGEAVVTAKVPDIVVKGDTIEYNAASYTSEETDMLKDMVKNIPGVEVDDDGNIKANGKAVTKILIDGKEFFGNDMALALSNLPANMIKKLQLFKEESEESKLTGFKDTDPDQVINLVVKEELKKSTFADARAGYGNKGKYNARGVVNRMQNDNQLSVVANVDNVRDSDSYSMDNGIDKNASVGTNVYINPSEKFRVGGYARYSTNDNEVTTISNTETFIATGNRLSESKSTNKSGRDNTSFGANIKWDIDSLTTIYANSSIYYNSSDNGNLSNSLSFVAEKDTTSSYTNNFTKNDNFSLSNNITIGRKLGKVGRTITFGASHSFRDGDSKGTNYSKNEYTDNTPDKIIDQQQNTKNLANNYRLSLNYVEPLGKDYSLQLSYSYAANHSTRDRNVLKKDANGDYLLVDSAYTRYTVNDFNNQNIGISFQGRKEKYDYTIGMTFEPSSSKNKISLGDSIIDHVKQNVWNYSPDVRFSYKPDSSTNLDVSYSGNTYQPAVSQLSADTTIVNAMLKYYGNPNLKPSYRNSFSTTYQKSDYENSRFFMLMGGFNYTFNNIVSYSEIDEQGATTNTYKNVNGDMGANLSVSYNTPLKNKKFTINTSTTAYYSKNIGFTNGDKTKTNNISLRQQLSIKFRSDKFETNVNGNIGHNRASNNLSGTDNQATTNLSISNFMLVKLPFDFSVQSNIQYTKYNGYGSNYESTEILWGASINKKILKNKKGTLRAQFFDILNDKSNVSRYVSSNYISDSRTNTISRYMLFSFAYQFSVMGK